MEELEDYLADVVKPAEGSVDWEDGSDTVELSVVMTKGAVPFKVTVHVLLPEASCTFADEVRLEAVLPDGKRPPSRATTLPRPWPPSRLCSAPPPA